jgi:hypothetical protein
MLQCYIEVYNDSPNIIIIIAEVSFMVTENTKDGLYSL